MLITSGSHYVYDRSGLYDLRWLPECIHREPVRWISMHAGIEEPSLLLRSLFPRSHGQIHDIYDPSEMTELSIRRARRLAATSSSSASPTLSAPGELFETAFLIFAAHELRGRQARERLFCQIAQTLCKGGELVLVEHVRDWCNFLAFGPGFLHFFSQGTWQAAAQSAGLHTRLHRKVTPFVHVFVFRAG